MSVLHVLGARAARLLDPEDAHRLTIGALALGIGPRQSDADDRVLATNLAGLSLANPIGLAAGFDKNAQAPDALLRAGFGFVECGTTTPKPQVGNAKPRLFRLAQDRAVINRMGFNNDGQDAFAARLRRRERAGIVGANVGANKDSPDRIGDYVAGLRRLWDLADYFTLNISSPNTPRLRDLQGQAALIDLLGTVAEARADLVRASGDHPVFLKVAPDLHDGAAGEIVDAAIRFGLDGLIVSNTTVARPDHLVSRHRGQIGGLSGAPLMGPSTELLRRFYDAAAGRLTLIGAGGIASGADAYAKIRAGATAVQLYSALAFAGPALVTAIKRDLAARLRADGFTSVAQAVGAV